MTSYNFFTSRPYEKNMHYRPMRYKRDDVDAVKTKYHLGGEEGKSDNFRKNARMGIEKNSKFQDSSKQVIKKTALDILKKDGVSQREKKSLVLFFYDDSLNTLDAFPLMIGRIFLSDISIEFHAINNEDDRQAKLNNIFNNSIDIKSILIIFFTHKSFRDEKTINDFMNLHYPDKPIVSITINFIDDDEFKSKMGEGDNVAKYMEEYAKSDNINPLYLKTIQFVNLGNVSKTFWQVMNVFLNKKNYIRYSDLYIADAIILPLYEQYQNTYNENSLLFHTNGN